MGISRKAESEVLSKIIILLIFLALSMFAYTWGSNLVDAQSMRTESDTMTSKLLELRQKITEVANSGNTSARFVDISLKHGTLKLVPGEPCSGTDPDSNMIIYSFSSEKEFVEPTSWTLSDTDNKNMLCTAPSENSSSGIIIIKHSEGTDTFENQYALWFRTLNQSASSSTSLINVSTGGVEDPLILSAGSHQLRVESQGAVLVGTAEYTQVLVSTS